MNLNKDISMSEIKEDNQNKGSAEMSRLTSEVSQGINTDGKGIKVESEVVDFSFQGYREPKPHFTRSYTLPNLSKKVRKKKKM